MNFMGNSHQITPEELIKRFTMLSEAKAAYARTHSGATSTEAYQKDPLVKEQADALFNELTYLFNTSIRTNDRLIRLQYTNSSHIGWEDIEAIALHGDSQNAEHFGGLMGAILTTEPDRSPKEILSYCKRRMYGEVIDAFRRRLGRSKIPNGKTTHARPLSSLARGDEDGHTFDAQDTHAGVPENHLLDAEYLRSIFMALDTLKEPYKTPVTELLQSSIAADAIDIDGLLEEESKHNLSGHAQGKDKTLRIGLLLLKCAYLNLDDAHLPDVIVNAKKNVQAAKGDWGEYSDAAFAYAKMLGFTLNDMATLVDLTPSRITQLHKQHNISDELLKLLGLGEQKSDTLAPKPLTKVKSAPIAYVNTKEAAEISGLSVRTIQLCANQIRSEQDYTPDGRIPEADYEGETVKGKTLVGKVFGSNRWLLHVGLVNAWAQAEKQAEDLANSGWQRLTKAGELLETNLSVRASAIDPHKKYLPDGRMPDAADKENAVLGSEIVWRHPYDLQHVLLNPRYIAAHMEAKKKMQELTDSGWQRLTKAAEQIGLSNSAISNHANAIDPKGKYLPDGTTPDKEHEKDAVLGIDVVWHHPYDEKVVLLRPEYVAAQVAAEEKVAELKEKGWKNLKDTAGNIGISTTALHHRMDKMVKENPDIEMPGSDFIYRHPYHGRVILMSPTYLEALRHYREKNVTVKKGGKLESLGPVRTLPSELANQLSAKENRRAI